MPLVSKQVVTSTVYGLVDLGTEWVDASQGNIASFRNITDIQRTLASLGGLALTYAKGAGMKTLGEDLATASIPLFEKTVVRAVRSMMGRQGFQGRLLLRDGPQIPGQIPPLVQNGGVSLF